uniref:Uncharacterized protein n=1 Tax=Solanum lycopersicum TaxID=4081 RepID=A0A3Q7J7I2_SOLLC
MKGPSNLFEPIAGIHDRLVTRHDIKDNESMGLLSESLCILSVSSYILFGDILIMPLAQIRLAMLETLSLAKESSRTKYPPTARTAAAIADASLLPALGIDDIRDVSISFHYCSS